MLKTKKEITVGRWYIAELAESVARQLRERVHDDVAAVSDLHALGWTGLLEYADTSTGELSEDGLNALATTLYEFGRAGVSTDLLQHEVGSLVLSGIAPQDDADVSIGLALDATGIREWVSLAGASSPRGVDFLAVGSTFPTGSRRLVDGVALTEVKSFVNLAGEPCRSFTWDASREVNLPAAAQSEQGGSISAELVVATTLNCARTVGALRGAFDITSEYARERRVFGRILGEFQAPAHALAQVHEAIVLSERSLNAALKAAVSPSSVQAGIAAAAVSARTAGITGGIVGTLHRINGAIGLTAEYHLGRRTLRALAWSTEYHTAPWWRRQLAEAAVRMGEREYWRVTSDVIDQGAWGVQD